MGGYSKDMEELFNYIRKFGILNAQDELLIAKGIQEITVQKGDPFIEAGKVSQRIAFVKEGVFRSLYYNRQEMILPAILSMKEGSSEISRALLISFLPMNILKLLQMPYYL